MLAQIIAMFGGEVSHGFVKLSHKVVVWETEEGLHIRYPMGFDTSETRTYRDIQSAEAFIERYMGFKYLERKRLEGVRSV